MYSCEASLSPSNLHTECGEEDSDFASGNEYIFCSVNHRGAATFATGSSVEDGLLEGFVHPEWRKRGAEHLTSAFSELEINVESLDGSVLWKRRRLEEASEKHGILHCDSLAPSSDESSRVGRACLRPSEYNDSNSQAASKDVVLLTVIRGDTGRQTALPLRCDTIFVWLRRALEEVAVFWKSAENMEHESTTAASCWARSYSDEEDRMMPSASATGDDQSAFKVFAAALVRHVVQELVHEKIIFHPSPHGLYLHGKSITSPTGAVSLAMAILRSPSMQSMYRLHGSTRESNTVCFRKDTDNYYDEGVIGAAAEESTHTLRRHTQRTVFHHPSSRNRDESIRSRNHIGSHRINSSSSVVDIDQMVTDLIDQLAASTAPQPAQTNTGITIAMF